ncbi:MAG: transglutaminase family protein [Tractidigestivibacter sp.]|jgi:transglutaminase-like putative cysteine protease|uniref:transglutaminase family protein n=1 Tax=Tractidigestivibacter sp. TaxID=2847320 RepID=UPI003D8CBDF3
MRALGFYFETILRLSGSVYDHDFVLRCLPRSSARQTVMDSNVTTSPSTALVRQVDGFGNILLSGRIPQKHDLFSFFVSGVVLVDEEARLGDSPWKDGPESPLFSHESALTKPDLAIRQFAADVLVSMGGASAYERAVALCKAVGERMSYVPGSTDVATTAGEALAKGSGVCQDYTHILLALCRYAGIPARYASGFLLGEGATHAWVEVFDGKHWRGLDPTNGREAGDDYIVMSYGRDFDDCSIERGVFRGCVQQTQTVRVTVRDEAFEEQGGGVDLGAD